MNGLFRGLGGLGCARGFSSLGGIGGTGSLWRVLMEIITIAWGKASLSPSPS